MLMDLPHALQHTWRSLSDIQSLILAGNRAAHLKPLHNLKLDDLKEELQARGVKTEGLSSYGNTPGCTMCTHFPLSLSHTIPCQS